MLELVREYKALRSGGALVNKWPDCAHEWEEECPQCEAPVLPQFFKLNEWVIERTTDRELFDAGINFALCYANKYGAVQKFFGLASWCDAAMALVSMPNKETGAVYFLHWDSAADCLVWDHFAPSEADVREFKAHWRKAHVPREPRQ